MTSKQPVIDHSYDQLHFQISSIADKLCQAVDNKFDFTIQVESKDLAMQKLAMLINFVLDSAHRAITDIQQEYDRATATEAEMKAILDNAPNAIILLSTDGTILSSNVASEQILGYPSNQLNGSKIETIISKKQTELLFGMMSEDGLNNKIEFDIKMCDGTFKPVELSGCRNHQNDSVQIICIIRDLTEIREKEWRIAEVQREYQEVSRHAGKAEIATEILHNVGNILNSVNIAAASVNKRLSELPVENALQAAQMLLSYQNHIQQFENGDQGVLIIDYILKFSENLVDVKQKQQKDLLSLIDKIDHIKTIICMQQEHAKWVSVTEEIDINNLLDDLLDLNKVALGNNDIHIAKKYTEVSSVITDRHKLMSVLMNVIGNAKDALRESSGSRNLIVCTVQHDDEITITVSDDGIGISSEDSKKLFTHGFTTKKDGHGFGLHSCANTMKQLGGELTLQSEGINQGCQAIINLPITKEVTHGHQFSENE